MSCLRRRLGVLRLLIILVTNRPRFSCYSQLPTEAYWSLLGPSDAYHDLSKYLFLACYLPAIAWTGTVYLSRSLHLRTIEL